MREVQIKKKCRPDSKEWYVPIKHLERPGFFVEEQDHYCLVVVDYDEKYYKVLKYIKTDNVTIFAEYQKIDNILIRRSIVDTLLICGI